MTRLDHHIVTAASYPFITAIIVAYLALGSLLILFMWCASPRRRQVQQQAARHDDAKLDRSLSKAGAVDAFHIGFNRTEEQRDNG